MRGPATAVRDAVGGLSGVPRSVLSMIIDCGTCAVAGPACDDCVVTVLLGMPQSRGPAEPTLAVLADEHAAAVTVLAESGLIPPLRLVPRTQAS